MSHAKKLAHETMGRIHERLGLAEELGGGGPYLPLRAETTGQPVGALRLFGGKALEKLVYVGLEVPQFNLDSHMLFGFTKASSAVPHFTLDAVWTGEFYAFHLDLVPRVDLGADLGYLDGVMHPLSPAWQAAQRLEGLSPAHIGPRQRALMSPWMLAHRATEAAFAGVAPLVDAYAAHWLALVEAGVQTEDEPRALERRDRLNRAAIFNPDVDPVWARVDRLVGAETGSRMREILRSQDVTP